MKRRLFTILLSLLILFVLAGCSSTPKASSNSLKITQTDEKIIQKYLDARTNDISAPNQGGKMYSAFKVFGTDSNKIYASMLKYEYLKQGNELTNGVSTPIVLYVKTKGDKIEIENHEYPKDGRGYGRSLKKLFPQNVIEEMNNNYNELTDNLEETVRSRVKEYAGGVK